jgi:hypothetical protein
MAWSGSRGVNTTAAGYGTSHQELRKALLPQAYGKPCYRCGKPMLPGQELHLDHTDDRTGYGGFSHRACNLRAAARKARAIQLKRWRGGGTVPQATTVHRW